MQKKATFKGLLAWVVITPHAMLTSSYNLLVKRLDRILGSSAVKGDYGVLSKQRIPHILLF